MNEESEGRIYWHAQNLNEDSEGCIQGSILRHGRGWLRLLPRRAGSERHLGAEWKMPSRFCHCYGEIIGDENEVSVSLAIGLFSVWLHAEGFLPKRLWRINRKTGVSIHDAAIWFEVWSDPNGWDSRDPKWQKFNFCPVDFFLGRQVHSSRVLKTERVLVPMPEGSYPATVNIEEAVWKRPRWPFPIRRIGSEITPDKPIPHPGKGENSWDCDDDATYSMSCGATNAVDAAAALAASVMRDRERHGGPGWVPIGSAGGCQSWIKSQSRA